MLAKSPLSTWLLAGIGLVLLAAAALGLAYMFRTRIPAHWQVPVRAAVQGIRIDHDIRIVMDDGVRLAASLYLPSGADKPGSAGKLATIYIALPYDRLRYREALNAAVFFAEHGYAVLLQDVRGTYGSDGELLPWRHATSDGATTLDWIARQPWSNGKVGTFGCSALGELQYALARAQHPAHAAMVVSGAGGGLGSARDAYLYYSSYYGGIFQLATNFRWFVNHGAYRPDAPPPRAFDERALLRELPIIDLVRKVRPAPNGYDDYLRMPLGDPAWEQLNVISATDRLTTPALVINTWADPSVAGTLALAEFVRRRAPADAPVPQHVVIAPARHCEHESLGQRSRYGVLEVRNAEQPYRDWNLAWFDHWLRGRGDGLAELPAYLYFVLGENRWRSSPTWPPPASHIQRWYVGSGGHANSREGDGVLALDPTGAATFDQFRYDPADPVPTRGGPECCSGDPAIGWGAVEQGEVERRDDVLVYTSAPLPEPLLIAGDLRATLWVSSSAPDTDFVVRLVDVWPDGRAINIQEGELRARYRNGIDHPEMMQPGHVYPLEINMRSIAYRVPAGHRLRLDITSSSFPRLARNLNTGGRNYDETRGVVARNRVHHDGSHRSYLELPVLDTDDQGASQPLSQP